MSKRATEFSKDLKRALEKHMSFMRRSGIVEWKKEWKPEGVRHGGVDLAGLNRKEQAVILIEAELRRDDPAGNILKVWMWARKRSRNLSRRFVFLQAFARAYYKTKAEQRRRSLFLADRLCRDIKPARYRPIRLHYNPRAGGKRGAGARTHHATNLALSVVRHGRALLG